MANDPTAPPAAQVASGFQQLIEGLRDDVREDVRGLRDELGRVEDRQTEQLAKLEERVTAKVTTLEARVGESRELLVEFAKSHADEHEVRDRRSQEQHSELWEKVRTFELVEARRAGALGVFRYGIELVSKHAPNIGKVVLALAALAGVVTGAIRIDVGA